MKSGFTTFNIIKSLDVSREKLQDWMNRGYVIPTKAAEGQGTKAIFSKTRVYGVALFKSLISKGLSRQVAANAINKYLEYEAPEMDAFIVIRFDEMNSGPISMMSLTEMAPDASGFHWNLDLTAGTCNVGPVIDPLKSNKDWDTMIVINFSKIRKEVDSKLEEL